MRISHPKQSRAQQFRSAVFGIEDSLVSTVGVLSGVAIADVERATIFLTGVVLIFVEAFSMGVGSYLSETSGEAYVSRKNGESRTSLKAAAIMFIAYFCSGFIPLSPYVFLSTERALPLSVSASLTALFILGVWSGSMTKGDLLKNGIRMLIIGGAAIGLGILAGQLVG
jgi:VIT1/CCC1 family predicted Fe2+/Mn2+ transporter